MSYDICHIWRFFMRVIPRIISILVLISIIGLADASEPLKKLAKKLEKGLESQTNKKVAVLNFPYHDGGLSSGSSIVQERLTTFLVEGGKIEVIERNLLKKVLEEMKMETTGIIDDKTTQQLGKILGVGAIVSGTLNDIKDNKTEINARVIQTETGKILSAGQIKVERTWTDLPVKPDSITVPPEKSTATTTTQLQPFLGKPLIQISILLDTSNSMDGLINQAKSQLWKIVNELVSSERDGNNPVVQVALYEYGNDNLSAGEGYIRQVLPFTTDLDNVSEKLFALTTRGGQEYCGAVIKDAVNGLQWDKHADVYKTIFIAGNEPFSQGPVDFRESISFAVKKSIFVNTIFCGRYQEGIATQWKSGADIGGGDYLNIDQWVEVVSIKAPQDDEIQRLGNELNTTYIPYGSKGKKARERQVAEDKKAEKLAIAGAPLQRSLFKASKQYSASASWDIVTEVESDKMKVENLKKEDLPQELQAMSNQELKKYVQDKSNKRKELQNKINLLNEARRQYVSAKEKEMAAKGEKQTLDHAMLKTIKTQASKKKFKFKE